MKNLIIIITILLIGCIKESKISQDNLIIRNNEMMLYGFPITPIIIEDSTSIKLKK